MSLHEVIDAPEHIGLVLSNAEGGELFNYLLEKKKLSEKEAAGIFGQLVDGFLV